MVHVTRPGVACRALEQPCAPRRCEPATLPCMVRLAALTLMMLFAPGCGGSPEAPVSSAPVEDLAGVLTAALSDVAQHWKKKRVVVQAILHMAADRRIEPEGGDEPDLAEGYKAELGGLRRDTTRDFFKRHGGLELLPVGIGGDLQVIRWTTAQIAEGFTEDTYGAWELIHDKFPDCLGIVQFAPVGFSASKQQALVFVEHTWHAMGGKGELLLLEIEDGAWKVIARSEVWTA